MTQNSLTHAPLEKQKTSRNRWIRSAFLLCGAFVLIFSQLAPLQVSAEPDVDPGLTVFGVDTFEFSEQGGSAELIATESGWVRGFELVWSDLEPLSSEDDWVLPLDLLDQIDAARMAGLEPILTVRGTPTWAQKVEGYFCGPIKEDQLAAFAEFLAEAVGNFPLRSQIKYLEIWNEPDVAWGDVEKNRIWGGCWGDKSDPVYYGGNYYAEMLKVIYPVVKNRDPEVQILIGGLQMECDPRLTAETCNPVEEWKLNSTKFFDGILSGGGGEYFDGISFHAFDYYGYDVDSGESFPGTYGNSGWNSRWDTTGPVTGVKLAYLQERLAAAGVSGKFFLNTENSLLFDVWEGDEDFEETKAGYLLQSYASAIDLGLTANLWFEMVGLWDRGVGLLDLGLVPYPAYTAFQVASQKLFNVSSLGPVENVSLVKGYEFLTQNGLMWVIWSADGSEQTVDLGFTPLAVYDVYGVELSTPAHTITLGYQPVYVELPDIISKVFLPKLAYNFYPLVNGAFEAGTSGWSFVNAGLPASLTSGPALNPITGLNDPYIPAGRNSAFLGNPDYPCSLTGVPLGYAAVEQIITVPDGPDVGQVELTFDYIIYSQDVSPVVMADGNDQFAVYVTAGNNLQMLFEDNNRVNTNLSCLNWRRVPGVENVRDGEIDGWATGSVDLTAFAGMNVTLSFRNYNRLDGWYNTYTYLDNIQLVVTP